MNGVYYILFIFVATAFYYDIRKSIIPNRLNVTGVLAGFLWHGFWTGWSGMMDSLMGLGAGVVVLLLLYWIGALAAGDVKLFAAIGAIMGVEFTLYSVMYSILAAGAIGVLLLVVRGEIIKRLSNVLFLLFNLRIFAHQEEVQAFKEKLAMRFPFMYAVVPGVIITYYYTISG